MGTTLARWKRGFFGVKLVPAAVIERGARLSQASPIALHIAIALCPAGRSQFLARAIGAGSRCQAIAAAAQERIWQSAADPDDLLLGVGKSQGLG